MEPLRTIPLSPSPAAGVPPAGERVLCEVPEQPERSMIPMIKAGRNFLNIAKPLCNKIKKGKGFSIFFMSNDKQFPKKAQQSLRKFCVILS